MKTTIDMNIDTTASAATNTSAELSRIGVAAIGITAGVIGCWAMASMIAGVANSGGPIDLISNLFTAITG